MSLLLPKLGKRLKKPRKRIARRAKFKTKSNPFKIYHERHSPKETAAWLQEQATRMREKPTDEEKLVAQALDRLGIYHKRQHVLHNIVTGACCIADEWIPDFRLVIELDGFQHRLERRYDAGRDKWIAEFSGFRVERRWNQWAREPDLDRRLLELLSLGRA